MTTYQDKSGGSYESPDNKPATSGATVVVNTTTGPKQGVMVEGFVVTNS